MKNRLLLLLLAVFAVSAFGKTKLEGVWQLVKVEHNGGPNAGTVNNSQPGLMIFTGKYYSMVVVISDKPRTDVEDLSKATAAELQATLGPFVANSGTYDISGDTLTTRPMVAKMPKIMSSGSSATHSFKLEGDTLTMTNSAAITGSTPSLWTFKRVE